MKKALQQRYLSALSQTGNHTDALLYIEENLTNSEFVMLRRFIGWLGDNKAPLGPVSITTKFNEFATTAPAKEYANYEKKFDEMAKGEVDKTVSKAKSFVADNLVPEKTIQLHAFGYPLENCTVVSWDPATNHVVLKLK